MVEVTLTFQFSPDLVERASTTLRQAGFEVAPDPAPHDPGIVIVQALVNGDDGNKAVNTCVEVALEALMNEGLGSGICGSFIVIGGDTETAGPVFEASGGLRVANEDKYSAELDQLERSTRWTRRSDSFWKGSNPVVPGQGRASRRLAMPPVRECHE